VRADNAFTDGKRRRDWQRQRKAEELFFEGETNVKQAIRQSGLSIFMAVASTAIQHTNWDTVGIIMATFAVIGLGAMMVYSVGEKE